MNAIAHQPRITLQHGLALGLMVVESVAIWLLSRSIGFSVFIVVLSFSAAFCRWRVTLTRQRAYDAIAVLALIFVGKYIFVPDNPRYTTLFGPQQIMYAMAQYLMTLQALLFLLRRRDNRLPLAFSGIGIMALVCAAVVQVTTTERFVFQGMCVAHVLLAILFCSVSRTRLQAGLTRSPSRAFLLTLVLMLVGGTGWFVATMLHRYERQMDEFVLRFIEPDRSPPTRIGFTETPRLGSVALQRDSASADRIAFRVVADKVPGYLRARAFDEYRDQQWHSTASSRLARPLSDSAQSIERSPHAGQLFELQPRSEGDQSRFEFWPAPDLAGIFAMPLNSRVLQANTGAVAIDTHGVVRSENVPTADPYSVVVAGQAGSLEPHEASRGQEDSELFLRMPDWANDDPEIRGIADSIFAGAKSDREKIEAVCTHLSNGSYDLNVTVPAQSTDDPVQWFLKESPPAHCEYFASATTVLLRMGGVRCRFVTGFVATERNPFSGEWIARNRDAHAWVEVFDSETGWITVEATPTAGIPLAAGTGTGQQFREFVRDRFQRLRVLFQQHGARGIARWFGSFLLTPMGMSLATVVLAVQFWWLSRRITWPDRWRRSVAPAGDRKMVALLSTMDRCVKKLVRPRPPAETLLRYADVLQESAADESDPLNAAADWYREYSAARYTVDTGDERVELLQLRAGELRDSLRRAKTND